MKSLIITHKIRKESREAIICSLVFFSIIVILFILKSEVNNAVTKFLMLFGIGYLTWTFTEYFMHRFWMHSNLKDINSKTYQTHMNHHKHPTDIHITGTQRLIFVITGIAMLTLAIYLDNYFTCFVGFYFGFVFYTILHVVLHHRYGKYIVPRIQIAHIHHHGKYPETGYSFSTILWDYMFGTMAPKDAVITKQMEEFYFKHE